MRSVRRARTRATRNFLVDDVAGSKTNVERAARRQLGGAGGADGGNQIAQSSSSSLAQKPVGRMAKAVRARKRVARGAAQRHATRPLRVLGSPS